MTDAWDGRPQNPERDGWHWLESPRKFVRPCLWNPVSKTWLERGSVEDMRRAGWRYIAPCPAPDALARLLAEAEARGREAEREACALIAEGAPYVGQYRTWPWWTNPDGSIGNRSNESEIVRHADKIAAAIRARKE